LMSCSARLPVYLLLIAAFIPAGRVLGGWLSLQGIVLFAMMSLGAVVAIPVAWLLQRYVFHGDASAFVLELPQYHIPSPRLVAWRVYEAGKAFVMRAGTLIFATTVLLWAVGYFPGDHRRLHELETLMEQGAGDPDVSPEQMAELETELNAQRSALMQHSYLGRAGRMIEPLVRPLGWDGNIGIGVLASFPAREVVIATLGTIYSLGSDVDEESQGLQAAMRASHWPDGRPVFNIPVALSIMVFFALCAQCASTLVVIRRETNSWRWPAFSFVYMTMLAYMGALITYQVGMRLTGA
jgi:ferrous iron transport protein B